MLAMTTINSVTASSQPLNLENVKAMEHQLDDVMELIDTTELKVKLNEVEENYKKDQTELNHARLGIIYHETALNLSFLTNSTYKGYAGKSFDILTELFASPSTTKELLPFVASYRASALALASSETKKLKLLGESFDLFDRAVADYAAISYAPEFMRGSVAENLPWIFFSKRKYAKRDLQSIIEKYERNASYANWKIMSFTYWAWAKQFKSKKYRGQALRYLDKAIALDPYYKAGRKRAEELKQHMLK